MGSFISDYQILFRLLEILLSAAPELKVLLYLLSFGEYSQKYVLIRYQIDDHYSDHVAPVLGYAPIT